MMLIEKEMRNVRKTMLNTGRRSKLTLSLGLLCVKVGIQRCIGTHKHLILNIRTTVTKVRAVQI